MKTVRQIPFLKYFLLITALILLTTSVSGQVKKKRIKRSNGLRFSFFDATLDSLDNTLTLDGFFYGGGSFVNKVNSLGRDNNVNQTGFSPILGFQKNNWDFYVNGFRWSKTLPKWAETDIGISKFWQIAKPLSITASYEHAFIHYGSDDDKFGINNLVSTQLAWANPVCELATRYEYDWGRYSAAILEFSVGKDFEFFDVFVDDKIEIEPRLYISHLGNPSHFQLANYELELPITWRKIGNVEFGVNFNYAIPKNILPEEGNGKPVFYFSLNFIKVIPIKKRVY